MGDEGAFGFIASRYELEKELGRGASGVVYSALDRTTGSEVALKLARAKLPHRHNLAADALVHEHIVSIQGRGTDCGVEYVVMERVHGVDLARHCMRPVLLPFRLILSIVARVADALAHAHARGCAHGDVKPANILYGSRDDRVKLGDFAAVADSAPCRGTPAYMAPEQVCGSFEARSDQFSLGVTAYQLSCGALPFAAPTLPRLFRAIVNEPHRDVREHHPLLPAAFAAVLDRLLAKTPRERFADMHAAAGAVRQLVLRPQP